MNSNPLDIRTVLLAKHAQHVVLIHFPIALFTAAVAFDYLALWTKNRMLTAAAYFNLLLAAVSDLFRHGCAESCVRGELSKRRRGNIALLSRVAAAFVRYFYTSTLACVLLSHSPRSSCRGF